MRSGNSKECTPASGGIPSSPASNFMTATQRKIFGWTVLVLLPIAYVVGSEIYYARKISPHGVSTVGDFFRRFGDPPQIRMVQHDGHGYYEFTGPLPSRLVLATPSAPPVYVFDGQGRFAAWCRDPGDVPGYSKTWLLQSTNLVAIGLIKEKFGLK